MTNETLNGLRAAMTACEQTTGLSVLQHGEMVAEHYADLIGHLRDGKPLAKVWSLPDWINDPIILDHLLDDELMATYLTYHDVGKPFCLVVDEEGKRHFPDHAAVSERTWLENGGDPQVASLIGRDMLAHTIKDADVDEFSKSPDAIALILSGLSEITANASMFGGFESVSYKIKAKQIQKRGAATLRAIAARR